MLKGYGISVVKHLSIFNRWGELIFRRNNFQMNDINAAWDGKYKGIPVPSGAYIYIVEMNCNDQTFMQKGTITVVY